MLATKIMDSVNIPTICPFKFLTQMDFNHSSNNDLQVANLPF